MRNFCLLLVLFFTFSSFAFSQAPFISTGPAAGLGNYGYLEKEAVTFVSLARNTYTGIDFLSARFWVTDNVLPNPNEYLYHTYNGPDFNWNCNNAVEIKRTTDFNPIDFGGEWVAGADVNVSVFAKYCPIGSGPWDPGTPDNARTGFSERTFKEIDIISSSHTSTTNMVGDGNGACNTARVVGSFIINPGSATGINLTRLRIRNTGTSQEGTDIANGGFRVYHEAVTGTEVFDGTETDGGQLWGDWGGDASNNNFFENAALNIPITGATRVYILLCDLVTGFTPNQTVNLNIVNDGLSFAPLLNTFFGLMRIDETDITNKVVILPHRITHFSGKIMNDHNLLSLSVVNIKENETILLQRSVNNNNWNSIHTFNTIMQDNLNATFRDVEQFKQQVYYRALIINRVNGKKEYSDILRLERNNGKSGVKIYQEATTKAIYLESFGYTGNLQLQLIDVNGRLLGTDQILSVSSGQKQLLMLHSPSSTGLYFLKAVLQDGTQQVLKIAR